MKALTALAVGIALAVPGFVATPTVAEDLPESTPPTTTITVIDCPRYTGAQHRALVRRAFRGLRLSQKARERHVGMLRCSASEPQRRAWKAAWRQGKRRQVLRRKIDRATPYGRWAIPGYVVACESRGDWGAYNASGAAGPYQLMPMWGRPFPVRGLKDKLTHHRIAGDLWAGGAGAGNWVCA